MSKDFAPFILLAVACIPVLLFTVGYFFQRRRKSRELGVRSRALADLVGAYENRLATIETHALDYMNSLTTDGNKALYEIKEIVGSAKNLLDEVEELIATGDFAAFAEADKLLRDDFPISQDMRRRFDGTYVRRYPKYRNWKDVVENHLQQVGREVSRASTRAEQSGVPKRKKRQSTVVSLMQAGVRAVTNQVRMQQAPVRTLLRKNNSLKA